MQFGHFIFNSLPPVATLVAWAVFSLLLLFALVSAPWRALMGFQHRQHALMIALVVLCLIWSFRFQVVPGLHLHPFLVTTVTLVFGWSFCVLVGALACGLLVLVGTVDLQSLPWDWMFTVFFPASLTLGLLYLIERLPTRNLFVYILGLGFFGTLLTTLINCLLLLLFFKFIVGPDGFTKLWDNVAFVVHLLYSEGFINGVLVTSITVFMPDLVKTFDDHRFLKSD